MHSPEMKIHTPEQVSLSYTLAGIGSRAIAQIIDLSVIGIVYILLGIGTLAWNWLHLFGQVTSYLIGLVVVISFFVFWGYFISLEYFLSGSTIGKRLVRIRVVRTDGRPIGFYGSVVRNLLRIVDFLPTGYLIGVISMLIDRHERRIGDLASGTIVVLDTSVWALSPLSEMDKGDTDETELRIITVTVKGSSVSLQVQDTLPEPWVRHISEFERRLSGLSRQAREPLVLAFWDRLTSLPSVTVLDGATPADKITTKDKMKLISSARQVLKRHNKRLGANR